MAKTKTPPPTATDIVHDALVAAGLRESDYLTELLNDFGLEDDDTIGVLIDALLDEEADLDTAEEESEEDDDR